MTILIPATKHSPAVTLADIRAAADDILSLSHMRDVVDDCSTQVGRERCAAAYREIDRLETALFRE